MHAGNRFKVLTDSGAALLLAHTSIFNMIEDCYKTKILPTAVHLKTVDGSSMSSLGRATLYLHIVKFKFSHTFIICDKLPDTDILFGIDIHTLYQIYHIYSDKQLFIQRKGSYLTYTKNCEQQCNIAVVKSSFKIPPRHNGAIPVTIKGHNLRDPVGYFISNQHTNMRLDASIHVIDGIYNINARLTLHIPVANYTNKHVTFNKGQCTGHIEPPIDHMRVNF